MVIVEVLSVRVLVVIVEVSADVFLSVVVVGEDGNTEVPTVVKVCLKTRRKIYKKLLFDFHFIQLLLLRHCQSENLYMTKGL